MICNIPLDRHSKARDNCPSAKPTKIGASTTKAVSSFTRNQEQATALTRIDLKLAIETPFVGSYRFSRTHRCDSSNFADAQTGEPTSHASISRRAASFIFHSARCIDSPEAWATSMHARVPN
jgi:hypothetical protein